MDSILVVGAERVVGGNLAAYFAEHIAGSRVIALTGAAGVAIPGCDTRISSTDAATAGCLAQIAPQQVVYCGAAACSSWEAAGEGTPASLAIDAAAWAQAAHAVGARFTFISSDAVFTGPWMFHDEEGAGRCESELAAAIRAAEQAVLDADPQALVVRTNAFGWSPLGADGWLEQRLAELRTRRLADQDFVRHATPMLATDLAGILLRAWQEGLSGVCHIAGAERINPLRFVQRLAEQYQLPWLSLHRSEALLERAAGFGGGECSLQTKRIRKAVCVAMPMISEGLARLLEQDQSGYRAKLCGESTRAATRAA